MQLSLSPAQSNTLLSLIDVSLKSIGLAGQAPEVRELIDIIQAAAQAAAAESDPPLKK